MRQTKGRDAEVVIGRHPLALSDASADSPTGIEVDGMGGHGSERAASVRMLDGDERLDVLCTGSLYAVAAALEAFGAEVV